MTAEVPALRASSGYLPDNDSPRNVSICIFVIMTLLLSLFNLVAPTSWQGSITSTHPRRQAIVFSGTCRVSHRVYYANTRPPGRLPMIQPLRLIPSCSYPRFECLDLPL